MGQRRRVFDERVAVPKAHAERAEFDTAEKPGACFEAAKIARVDAPNAEADIHAISIVPVLG